MISLLASSKLSVASKHGFAFNRIRGATVVPWRGSAATQIALFRSLAQQRSQAGLARAPEPEYPPETIRHDLPTPAAVPAYHRGSKFDRVPYWQKIPRWKDVTEKDFLSHRWGVSVLSHAKF